MYAEQFGCSPQQAQQTPMRWWLRWVYWEHAKNSQRAWQHSKQSNDWVKDLSPTEQRAMSWALEHNNE